MYTSSGNTFTRPVQIALISAFVMNFAGFAVLTFLAIYLTFYLDYSALQVGTIFAVLTLTSRVFPFFFGILGDRFGYFYNMLIGLLLRGAGFILLGLFDYYAAILISVLLIGMGTALYEPSASAIFGAQPEHIRKKVFPVFNQCLNGGAIVGPLAGGLFIQYDPFYLFILSACVFFILAFIIFMYRGQYAFETRMEGGILRGVKAVVTNKPFIFYSLSMIFFWFMFAQLTVALPLKMFAVSQSEGFVSFVITTNAVTGLLFMLMFKKIYEQARPLNVLKIGVFVMGCSLIMVSFFVQPYWLLFCVLLFTIGETLVLPSSDIAVANFSQTRYTATYFGFFEFSFAIGAVAGSYLGTWFMSTLEHHNLPWFVFGFAGIVGSLLLHVQSLRFRRREAKGTELMVE